MVEAGRDPGGPSTEPRFTCAAQIHWHTSLNRQTVGLAQESSVAAGARSLTSCRPQCSCGSERRRRKRMGQPPSPRPVAEETGPFVSRTWAHTAWRGRQVTGATQGARCIPLRTQRSPLGRTRARKRKETAFLTGFQTTPPALR